MAFSLIEPVRSKAPTIAPSAIVASTRKTPLGKALLQLKFGHLAIDHVPAWADALATATNNARESASSIRVPITIMLGEGEHFGFIAMTCEKKPNAHMAVSGHSGVATFVSPIAWKTNKGEYRFKSNETNHSVQAERMGSALAISLFEWREETKSPA